MKCLECGCEMTKGTIMGVGQTGGSFYDFTADSEKDKHIFGRQTIRVVGNSLEYESWYCPKCKKILMWMDGKEN